jgi:molybdopterin converting factor small subunit
MLAKQEVKPMIKVCFFASLRETLACAELQIDDFTGSSIADLLQHLQALRPAWREALLQPNLLSAINHTMATTHSVIHANDEVAFFPKVTGG